ncbi:DNA-directed RNA polymerase I subunit rpa49 [Henckelia pumila]|uniref:DNA-directed RNA polymerase I subunit rpa49 n=1 Tax=Henckelia pumila TaxID=405737 RepID=UPI003C6E9563
MGKSRSSKKNNAEFEEDVEKVKRSETLQVKIKSIGENSEKSIAPIIGYFPSGYDPLKKHDNSEENRNVKIYKSLYTRNPKKPRMQLVVREDGSQVNFVGTNYTGEATTPQLCNYALGVLDKETGVLKIVPIAANRIFRLEAKVGESEQLENELQEAELTAEDRDAKFRNLTVKYSTNKNIRRDVKIDTLRQTADPETQQGLDYKLKEIKMNKEALQAIASTANARNIPPYDMDATTSDMAYPLNKIILEGEWDDLLDIFELTQAGSEVNPDVYPSFVCNRVQKLKEIEDGMEKRQMAGILSYITHLIKFKDRNSMDGVSTAKRHKFPSIFWQKFSSMFGSNGRRIPDEKQQLLISYVLVLSMFADNFRTNPLDISKDLRMKTLSLRPHYQYLGCKFVWDNRELVATLPVPLEFQTTESRRR